MYMKSVHDQLIDQYEHYLHIRKGTHYGIH